MFKIFKWKKYSKICSKSARREPLQLGSGITWSAPSTLGCRERNLAHTSRWRPFTTSSSSTSWIRIPGKRTSKGNPGKRKQDSASIGHMQSELESRWITLFDRRKSSIQFESQSLKRFFVRLQRRTKARCTQQRYASKCHQRHTATATGGHRPRTFSIFGEKKNGKNAKSQKSLPSVILNPSTTFRFVTSVRHGIAMDSKPSTKTLNSP